MPDPAASTRSPRPDDSLTSPAWADFTSPGPSPDPHDAQTANTPATGGDSELADYGLGVGRSVGKYQVLKRLGSGGNGQVYAALHTELGKTVALKFFKGYVAARPQMDAMRREAQVLASLRHPGIVSVDDFSVFEAPKTETGVAAGSPPVPIPFIVMEYVPSEQTLGAWNRAQQPGVAEILRIGAEMCDAVEHAHVRGIIHRDLKPGNVLVETGVDHKPHPRVIDFGLSQLLASWSGGSGSNARTDFDRVTGTLQYMSPEQLDGNPMLIDHRSDVYALGVVIYELLCGRLPYNVSVKLTGELTNEIRHGTPLRPSSIRPELKGPIEDVLLRALEKDPTKRHQSAGDLGADLRRILEDKPLPWRTEPVGERAGRPRGRSPAASRTLIAIVAALVATYLAVALWNGGAWRPVNSIFERLVVSVGAPVVTSIDHVRIVELRDGLDIDAIARSLGVDGVSKDDFRSSRRLYGRLMERLATARPKAVAFDLHFPQASTHDEAFNKGVAALNAAGIDAVIGVKNIQRPSAMPGTSGAPALASEPVIADSIRAGGARWGYIQFGGQHLGRPMTVPLATRQGDAAGIPSLAMRAVTAARWPLARAEYEPREEATSESLVSPTRCTLLVRCYADRPGSSDHSAVGLGQFPLSSIGPWEDYTALGFAKEDEAALWTIELPARAAIESAARDFADVLKDSDDALRTWAQDKIILIGDARSGSDRGDFSTYIDAPFAYAHAAAIETLWKDVALRYPMWQPITWAALFGATFGALVGFALSGRALAQIGVGLGAAVALTAGAVFLYAGAGIVANPFVIIAALVIAMALTAGLSRLASSGSLAKGSGTPA